MAIWLGASGKKIAFFRFFEVFVRDVQRAVGIVARAREAS